MREAAVRKHAVSWLLLLVTLVAGCSHELSQEEMRKRAFRRTTVDEEEVERDRQARADAPARSAAADDPPATSPRAEAIGRGDDAAGPQPSATPSPASTGSAAPPSAAGTPAGAASNVVTGQGGEASESEPDWSLSTTRQPPEHPLSEEERIERTRRNMERIGVGLAAYTAKNERLPAAAIDHRGTPLLSWRVELLPYLGLEELHAQFRLNEPWNSRHNLSLLPLIPEVYQSPERFDERTNYLANRGVFLQRGLYMQRVEDGPENTAAIFEVDDDRAVPWTRPDDWQLALEEPRAGLGNLRGGGFFAVSVAGEAVWVPIPNDPEQLLPAFTPDTGERTGLLALIAAMDDVAAVTASPASGTASPAAAAGSATTAGRGAERRPAAGSAAASSPAAPASASGSGAASGNAYLAPTNQRAAVPGLLKQRAARQLFRDIYGDEYAAAEEPSEKRKFADELMETVAEVRSDPASHYVLLEIIREIAVQGDHLETALEAVDELGATYAVDHHELRRRTLASFVQKRTSNHKARHDRKLMERALRYSEEALQDEAFHDAEELCNLAIAAIGQKDDDDLVDRVARRRDVIKDARRAKREAEEALEKLEEAPDDVASQLALGRYLCFFADDWDNGLPILAKCSTGSLQAVVQQELAKPEMPVEQATVGDLWWTRAGRAEPGEALASKRRAILWYERALPRLPGGLQKVKIQKRLEDFEQAEKDREELISQR